MDFSVNFVEGQDESVRIVSDRSFITDEDLDPEVVNITIRITNPQLSTSQEFLTLAQDPPDVLEVTGINTAELIIAAPDPSITLIRDFITALVSVRYSNIADEPVGVDRLIEFTIFDGSRTNNPRASTTVNVVTINDVPVVDLNGDGDGVDGFVEYTEADPPILIASNAVLQDPDSLTLTEAFIEFTAFDTENESIAVDFSVLPIGSQITCNLSPCNGTRLVLSGTAPKADYQSLLRTLRYVNLKQPQDLPNLRDRTISVQVNDGTVLSADDTQILIDFLSINPRVIIQLDVPNQDYATTYTEGQPNSIPLVGTVRIVDTSLETLQSVVLTIRNNLPGGVREMNEEITINTAELGGLQIAIEINTVLKRITFSGEASVDDYLEAISRVRYRNTEDEPDPTTRFVDFVVNPGGGAPEDTAEANITIININDHEPVCSPASQTAFVQENTVPVALIYTLVATDADVGFGGALTYTQTDGDSSLFSTSSDGLVNLTGVVDFEDVQSYDIEVQVCDNGIVPQQYCCAFALQISITDFNDNSPMFAQAAYTFSITENNATDISTFVINDADSGINAEIVVLQIDSGSFSPESGCLGLFSTSVNPPTLSTVSPGLDFETSSTCRFNITAIDGGGTNARSGSAMITVNVLNQDDFPPEFTQDTFTFSIEEDNSFPQIIGSVSADDIDSPSFTFSLQNAVGFDINATSGEISILFETDFDTATNHTFEAVATDPNNNRATAEIIVNVIAINNDPPTLDLNTTDVDSDNALTPVVFVEESGSPVTLLTEPGITDPDDPAVPLAIVEIRASVANSDSPSLEILSVLVSITTPSFTDASPSDSSALVIRPTNPTQLNEVYDLIQSIQYENREDEISPCNPSLHPCALGTNSRTVLIQVNDGINDSPQREAYITFQPVNDPPALDLNTNAAGMGYSTLFEEGQGAVNIANVGFISLTDDDNTELTALNCILTNPADGPNEFLVINGTVPSGLTATLSADQYTIDVTGTASISDYVAVLSILQYNSNTSDPTETEREVNCYVSDGEADSNVATAEILYSAVNQPPLLDLDVSSGEVNYSVTFQEERGAVNLSAIVSIFDADDSEMSSLTVTLIGASSSQESLALSTPLPSGLSSTYIFPVLEVSGVAAISSYLVVISSVVYNNFNSEISDINDRFASFVVEDDGGAESDPVFAIIMIMPVDDNAPVFVPIAPLTVDENAVNGTRVGTLEVRDFDEPSGNDIPTFTILSASPAYGTTDFVIVNNVANPYQAFLEVAGPIDYDNRAMSYSLVIEAASGSFTTNTTVTVMVNNLPDIAPMFTVAPNVFQVYENEDVGENLMPPGVVAIDPDNLDTISYSIDGNVFGGTTLISINSNTGELLVANNIDRESPFLGTEFSVTITARDSNSEVQITATVEILGVNEFAPIFSPSSYLVNIEENAVPSTDSIATVSATDADEAPDLMESSGFASNITYSIRTGNGSGLFEIDSTSGEIFQLSAIDYEDFSSIILVVEANDNDFPMPLTSTANVQIVVGNINDEAPLFTNLPASITVSELVSQGSTIYDIDFEDSDVNANLQVQFLSPMPDMFTLNIANGELNVAVVSLDADVAPREFTYTVELTDLMTHPTFADRSTVSAQITITLEDENDITPQFTMAAFEGSVMENLDPGVTVLQVTATDGDYGFTPSGEANGNNIVEYMLGSDAPEGVFVIDEDTGYITTNTTLNREEQAAYTFTVIVWDSPVDGSRNLRTTQVSIDVLDQNEHSPESDPPQYFIFAEEDTSIPLPLQTYAASQWNTAGKYIRTCTCT